MLAVRELWLKLSNLTLEVFLTKHPLQHWNTGQILKVNAGSHLKIEKKKMKMDCTSLSDRDGELFRYPYCFLRLKYGNILENCSEMVGSFVIRIKL